MKTRHQAAINKEQVTSGPSCAKKSTSLTSRVVKSLEASSIYSNKALHLDMKEKERERKKLKAVKMAKIREEVPEEAEKYRVKERVKKHKQQHGNKVVKETGIKKLNTPMKRKIKTLKQQMKRQMKKELANTMKSSTDSLYSHLQPLQNLEDYISKAIWWHLSLKLKHKMTCALKIFPNAPKGFNHAVRKPHYLQPVGSCRKDKLPYRRF